MENNLQVFNSPEFGEISTLTINGEPWFIGKQVALALEQENPNRAIQKFVDEEDRKMLDGKTQYQFGIELGQRGGWIINESGLYSLIFNSRTEKAKAFTRWVTSEVLPSIRKKGYYVANESVQNSDPLHTRALKSAGEFANVLIDSFQIDEGLARTCAIDYAESVFKVDFDSVKKLIPTADTALFTPTQIGEQFDPKLGAYNVNLWLEHCKLQVNINGQWIPTEEGEQFAKFSPYTNHRSKHSDRQLKWEAKNILDFLREHPCPDEIKVAKKPSGKKRR